MNVHELTLQNYTAASGCPSACQPILYLGTAGSYGNEQINVVLGEGWQGLTVKAVFQPSGVPVVVPDGGGVISVPWEATQSVIAYPKGRISFQGYSSGRLVNTSDVPYTVGGSSAGTDNTPAPTPDEFQQFLQAVKDDAATAENAAKTAQEQAQAAAGSASASAESKVQPAQRPPGRKPRKAPPTPPVMPRTPLKVPNLPSRTWKTRVGCTWMTRITAARCILLPVTA